MTSNDLVLWFPCHVFISWSLSHHEFVSLLTKLNKTRKGQGGRIWLVVKDHHTDMTSPLTKSPWFFFPPTSHHSTLTKSVKEVVHLVCIAQRIEGRDSDVLWMFQAGAVGGDSDFWDQTDSCCFKTVKTNWTCLHIKIKLNRTKSNTIRISFFLSNFWNALRKEKIFYFSGSNY